MKVASIALLVIVACLTWADSLLPQMVVPPVTRQAKGADKNTQNNPESQQNSPDKAPAVVNVTVTNDPQYAAPHTQEKTNQESSKWPDPITLFTGLLVLVGAGQIFVYWKQKGVMERALLVSRRPRILIREMTLNEGSTDEKLRIECAVVNGGDATAMMLGSFADVQCVRMQNWRPRPVVINMGLGNILKSGEHFTWVFEVRPEDATRMALAQTREHVGDADENSTNLYVRGVLLYKDCRISQLGTA